MARRALAVALSLWALGAAACGSGSTAVTVLAASSLHDVLPPVVEAFEREHSGVEVAVAYGSSTRLAAQVEAGAPAAVIVTADEESAARFDVPARPFARTHLVIALAPGNPGGVRSVADLASVRTVLAAPAVPLGRYSAEVLRKAGVAVTPESHEPDARAVVTKVRQGEVDAALVYAADAGGLATVALAPEHDVEVTYRVAVLHERGQAFADFLVARGLPSS